MQWNSVSTCLIMHDINANMHHQINNKHTCIKHDACAPSRRAADLYSSTFFSQHITYDTMLSRRRPLPATRPRGSGRTSIER